MSNSPDNRTAGQGAVSGAEASTQRLEAAMQRMEEQSPLFKGLEAEIKASAAARRLQRGPQK